MNAAEICRYRKDILSQTKRCLHSQLGEPPSFYHRIHLLISDSERGLFANLLRGSPAIPGKPSQLFYSLHTAALNPVISPKEHFFRHIQRDLRASASADGTSPRPPGLTALPPVPPRPAPSPQSAPKPLFFGRLPLPLWCDLCTHWPGLGSCRGGGRPHRGSLVGSSSSFGGTTGWGRKPDFPLPWATTEYIDCPFPGEVRNHPKTWPRLSFYYHLFPEKFSKRHHLCMSVAIGNAIVVGLRIEIDCPSLPSGEIYDHNHLTMSGPIWVE